VFILDRLTSPGYTGCGLRWRDRQTKLRTTPIALNRCLSRMACVSYWSSPHSSRLQRAGPVTSHDPCQPEAFYNCLTWLRSSLSRPIAAHHFRVFDRACARY